MCFLKEAQGLCCFIFLQYKSFYLSILDDLKILWALSTRQGNYKDLDCTSKHTALSDVCTVICAANAELEPSFQTTLFSERQHSQMQRKDSSFVHDYVHSHSAQKPSRELW